jgi:integrase
MPVIENFQAFMAGGGLVCPLGKKKIEYSVADEPGLFAECRESATAVPVWYLRLKNAQGTNTYRKLGTVKELSLAQARKLVKQIRADHVSTLKSVVTVADTAAPVSMTLERFFHDVYTPQAKIHKRSFNKDESLFRVRIGPKFGHLALPGITRMDVQTFHHGLLKEGLSPATCNHHVVLIRRFLSVAVSLDLLQKNVLRGIPLMPVDNLRDVFLSPEQTTRFVEVLTTDANRSVCLALLFMLNTASRKMETLKAKWADIDLENQLWYIPAVNNKSKRPKTLPLNAGALQVLAQLESKGKSEYLFPSPESGRPYTTIARVFWRLRAKAGLPENFRVHDLRSSFSARYLGAGGSIFSLQKLLGHQDVRTTATHYARLSAKSLLEASNMGTVAMPQLEKKAA